MAKTTTRVQLELPERSHQRLKALAAKTEASSYAEVIRNSLRLFEAIVKEVDGGGAVFVRRSNGVEWPLQVFATGETGTNG